MQCFNVVGEQWDFMLIIQTLLLQEVQRAKKIKQIKNRFAGIVGVLTFRRIVGN